MTQNPKVVDINIFNFVIPHFKNASYASVDVLADIEYMRRRIDWEEVVQNIMSVKYPNVVVDFTESCF